MTLKSTARLLAGWVASALLPVSGAYALEVNFQPVADDVFAYIGDKGPRSVDNEGLNANIGLVVTPAGAALIDSGATRHGHGNVTDLATVRADTQAMPGNASRTYLEPERE